MKTDTGIIQYNFSDSKQTNKWPCSTHFEKKWIIRIRSQSSSFYKRESIQCMLSPLELINEVQRTRRANAQMIHICHNYRTSSQSSSSLNQPSTWSRTFELLHTTLQHKDATSSSFSVILWPWVYTKVIQTESKQQKLAVFCIILSLKKSVHKCPDTWQC